MSGKNIFFLIILLAFSLDLTDGKLGTACRPKSGEPVHHANYWGGSHTVLSRAPTLELPSHDDFLSSFRVGLREIYSLPVVYCFGFSHSAGGIPLY